MLSNKLTFSLTSLIVLLMLALCLPVDAQKIQGITVLTLPVIGDAGSVGEPTPPTTDIIDPYEFIVFGAGGENDETIGANTPAYVNAAGILQNTTADNIDFEEFLRLGGTIELIAPADPNDDLVADDPISDLKLGAKDLVISEINWALDQDAVSTADDDDRRQWIEIYNTMASPTRRIADLGDGTPPGHGRLKLRLIPFSHPERVGDILGYAHGITANGDAAAEDNPVVKHRIIDSVSNLQFTRWNVPGESGNTTPPRVSQFSDPPLKPLVSMYRNIDYRHIAARHKLDAGDNRTEQKKGVPDGVLEGSWKATNALGRRNTIPMSGRNDLFHATPGAEHVPDLIHAGVTKTSILSNSVVINEVRNDNSGANVDWVELYNAGTEAVDLHGWELSHIDGSVKVPDDGKKLDVMLVGKEDGGDDKDRFPKGANYKLQPGGYLLIVNRHPAFTPLANGVNIDEVIAGNEVKTGASHEYIVRPKLNIPNANVTLLLRSGLDKNSHHAGDNKKWQTSLGASELIMDYAGTVSVEVKSNEYNTLVWPFRGWTKETATDGKDGEGIPNNSSNALARLRYQANDGHHKDAWDNVGHKGGIGYDSGADLKYSPGTPGYPNGSLKNALVDDKATVVTTDDVLYDGDISISEIMYDAGLRWNLIQWIELYNASMTDAINLKGWELQIRNASDDVESYVDSGIVFNDAYILPNQTLLLVSGTATNDVAQNRVYNLYQHHRRELGLSNRRSVLLSPVGFHLELTDKNGEMIDEVGNVMVDGAERIVSWDLQMRNPEYRQSLVRQYGTREIDGSPDTPDDGSMMESWRQSDLSGAGISFYGHRDDASTPGYRLGGPLPVSLSKFRPVRNQDTGHVDIQWITESELNNAGFNILRSEAKNGAFKVINVKGIIAGHGTTSEQHVYKFTDTATKPNVVYYYQIEDVSINGLRTTLTTTHLRGHVGAAGKLTTTWGDLKLQK